MDLKTASIFKHANFGDSLAHHLFLDVEVHSPLFVYLLGTLASGQPIGDVLKYIKVVN